MNGILGIVYLAVCNSIIKYIKSVIFQNESVTMTSLPSLSEIKESVSDVDIKELAQT